MAKTLLKLLEDDRGASSVEYGLVAASIFLVIVTAVGLLGTRLSETFNAVASGFTP